MENPVQDFEFLDLSDINESERHQLQSVLYARDPNGRYPELPWCGGVVHVEPPPPPLDWMVHQQQYGEEGEHMVNGDIDENDDMSGVDQDIMSDGQNEGDLISEESNSNTSGNVYNTPNNPNLGTGAGNNIPIPTSLSATAAAAAGSSTIPPVYPFSNVYVNNLTANVNVHGYGMPSQTYHPGHHPQPPMHPQHLSYQPNIQGGHNDNTNNSGPRKRNKGGNSSGRRMEQQQPGGVPTAHPSQEVHPVHHHHPQLPHQTYAYQGHHTNPYYSPMYYNPHGHGPHHGPVPPQQHPGGGNLYMPHMYHPGPPMYQPNFGHQMYHTPPPQNMPPQHMQPVQQHPVMNSQHPHQPPMEELKHPQSGSPQQQHNNVTLNHHHPVEIQQKQHHPQQIIRDDPQPQQMPPQNQQITVQKSKPIVEQYNGGDVVEETWVDQNGVEEEEEEEYEEEEGEELENITNSEDMGSRVEFINTSEIQNEIITNSTEYEDSNSQLSQDEPENGNIIEENTPNQYQTPKQHSPAPSSIIESQQSPPQQQHQEPQQQQEQQQQTSEIIEEPTNTTTTSAIPEIKTWASLLKKTNDSNMSTYSSSNNVFRSNIGTALPQQQKPCARVEPIQTNSNNYQSNQSSNNSNQYNSSQKYRSNTNMSSDDSMQNLGKMLAETQLDHKGISLQPRGLINRSNYCYINAILQALVACPPFYNLLRTINKNRMLPRGGGNRNNARINNESTNTPIFSAMLQLAHEFQYLQLPTGNRRDMRPREDIEIKTGSPFEPNYVYQILSTMKSDSAFNIEGRQEDAEEFLTFLLNGLNDEMLEMLKCKDGNPQQGSDTKSVNKGGNNTQGRNTMTNGDLNGEVHGDADDGDWKEVTKESKNKGAIIRRHTSVADKTPVSEIFRGHLRTRVQRVSDSTTTENIQPFFTLPLDIEKASNVKDAFDQLVLREGLEGVTSTKTNQETEAYQTVTIEELPCVLMLHLKCFDYKLHSCHKIQKALEFPVLLNLESKWLSNNKNKKPVANGQKSRQYKLFAVVYHDGKEATKGHYITDVFHVGYSGWIRYDDSNVRFVPEQEVLHPKPPRVPYILYYRRADTIVSKNGSSS